MSVIRSEIATVNDLIRLYELSKNKESVRGHKNLAAYSIQQICEKLIKIQIYYRIQTMNLNINTSNIYTHNLNTLIQYGLTNSLNIYVPKLILKDLTLITVWESRARYSQDSFSVNILKLKSIYNELLNWYTYLIKLGIR